MGNKTKAMSRFVAKFYHNGKHHALHMHTFFLFWVSNIICRAIQLTELIIVVVNFPISNWTHKSHSSTNASCCCCGCYTYVHTYVHSTYTTCVCSADVCRRFCCLARSVSYQILISLWLAPSVYVLVHSYMLCSLSLSPQKSSFDMQIYFPVCQSEASMRIQSTNHRASIWAPKRDFSSFFSVSVWKAVASSQQPAASSLVF